MNELVSAVVLAGGRATRLGGANKALLEIGGKRIIDRVLDALRPMTDQIVLVGHLVDRLDVPDVQLVPDARPGAGSMPALLTGLQLSRNEVALVVGCDMPFLSTPLLRHLVETSMGFDLAVPRIGPHLEALHAAYHRSCLPVIEDHLRRQDLKIIDFYPSVKAREVPEVELRLFDPDLRSFLNVNTPEDLEAARDLVRGAHEISTQGG
jgi:molybdenum cofactor guanylyltransferase